MNCDKCKRPMNYAFYINDYYWLKVVGEDRVDKNVGRWCAHCTLEILGGASWYIMWNEPAEKVRANSEQIREQQQPAQSDGIVKLILEAVDDAVMRVGASANCYNEPADANSGAEYVAARVRSEIVAACSRSAQAQTQNRE